MVFEKCREILLRESELVQRIAGLQNLIREAVMNRNWTDFEGHFNDLGRIKAEFAALEGERELLFTGIPGTKGDMSRFYTLTAQLPPQQRGELTEIYRSLKLETLRVQVSGEALMSYIAEVRAAMAGFFEIAFPDRSGKIYTPHGMPVSHDMRSMVLNRAF
ncbi:MAG: hypothetical protein LBH20_02195 [Treponema sp.]|jgi:hypothetical protein|nr:hypothetical protein [Treponema sp.]